MDEKTHLYDKFRIILIRGLENAPECDLLQMDNSFEPPGYENYRWRKAKRYSILKANKLEILLQPIGLDSSHITRLWRED